MRKHNLIAMGLVAVMAVGLVMPSVAMAAGSDDVKESSELGKGAIDDDGADDGGSSDLPVSDSELKGDVDKGGTPSEMWSPETSSESVVKADFGVFTNTYTADSVSVSLSGKKVLNDISKTGKTLVGDDFSFSLKDSTGKVVETVKNDKDGKIRFSDIEYTQPGTYTYTIVEVKGEDKYITYDESVKSVTVVVTGADGKLTAEVKTADSTATAD